MTRLARISPATTRMQVQQIILIYKYAHIKNDNNRTAITCICLLELIAQGDDLQKLRSLSSLIFHPFLFAIYPTFAVLAGSLGILNPIQALRPSVLILLLTGLIFLVLFLILKDAYRTGYILSIVIFMLFYYGYSYRLPKEINILGLELSRHLIILLFWAIFLPIVLSNWVWERIRPQVITKVLNISSFIALLLPLRLIAVYILGSASDPLTSWHPPNPPDMDVTQITTEYKPDIYYIIVDGYGREDVLNDYYNLDNSEFIDFLERLGFYVADESTSNYSQTSLSIASSLNFEYLDYLALAGEESKNHKPLNELMLRSKTRYYLEQAGYKIFLSGELIFAQMKDPAIVFYNPNYTRVTVFESLLLGSSLMEIAIEQWNLNFSDYTYQRHRERVLDGFSQINSLVNVKSPIFALVHIISPHPPFVFDQEGHPIDPNGPYNIFDSINYGGGIDEYISGYRDQVYYINTLLEETLSYIIDHSDVPPVIILQADHGPAAYFEWDSSEGSCIKERFSILNAYYLPRNAYQSLYENITPVNTFRLIFDNYFNTRLGFLMDRNYYSSSSYPYKFTEVSGRIEDSCKFVDAK